MNATQWGKVVGIIGAVWLLAAGPAVAATITTAQAGDWSNTTTWVSASIPQDGDTVIVNHNITLTNGTASLAAYTINAGKTNTFCTTNAILYAQQVNVYGTLTHTNNTATSTNAFGQWVPNGRVFIICSNLLVDATGRIKADAVGYAGRFGSAGSGYGPGGGTNAPGTGAGGGYGGPGGAGWNGGNKSLGGVTYGSASAPDQPGSGGGNTATGDPAGAGGGLIWIQATQGTVTVNGQITADGGLLSTAEQLGTGKGGGGSGGGISIACRVFAGSNGLVSAAGGLSQKWWPGAGGGGRIAITVDTNAQAGASTPIVAFRCGGGSLPPNPLEGGEPGVPGTIYVNDTRILPTTWLNGGGELQGFSAWAPAQLAITNSQLSFLTRVQLSVSGNIAVGSTGTRSAALTLTNASSLTCGNLAISNGSVALWRDVGATMPTLMVTGDLSLNTGMLYVSAALTNAATPAYGALVSVAGTTSLTNGSVVYPFSNPTNGGSVCFSLKDLTIAFGSGFNADGNGYWGAPPSTSTNGFGPGGGKFGLFSSYAGGGGHGGLGGDGGGALLSGGGIYGASNAPPVFAGSGGGNKHDGNGRAGDGGGLIWIESDGTVTLNGYLKASGVTTNATDATYQRGGGGSGGGIYVTSRRLQGSTGTLTANGSIGRRWGGGGGGGGRIQVWSKNDLTGGALATSVLPGAGTEGGSIGAVGTVHYGTIPLSGTTVSIR